VVHVALIATAAVSLAMEPVLTIHIGVGLLFVALVAGHLTQRRQVGAALVRRLTSRPSLRARAGRLAASDGLLAALTAAMFVSGMWDWLAGRPTQVRWHAITSVLLVALLVVHTLRRRRRLLDSAVR
jgi:hypothetical protein